MIIQPPVRLTLLGLAALVGLAALLTGCGGGISGSKVVECINASGLDRQARFQENEFLVYDEVHVLTPSSNTATIYLYDSAERAKEDNESGLVEDFTNEEKAKRQLVRNASVYWDERPFADDRRVVARCLRES